MANFFKDYHAEIKSRREQEQRQVEQAEKTEKLTAQDIETAIIEFLEDQPETEYGEIPFHKVDNVRPFEGYLCTLDKGVVIDLKDGTQILLTIQIR